MPLMHSMNDHLFSKFKYLGENKAPSPQGAVDMYRWNCTSDFTRSLPESDDSIIVF